MTDTNWSARLRREFARAGASPDTDVIEELAQHAAAAFEAARADGLSPTEADRRVAGLIDRWTADETVRRRQPKRAPMPLPPPAEVPSGLSGLALDLRFGARMLGRQRGPVAMAVLTIALGIGAATTLASVVYHVLLQPLPWPNASRLVQVSETREGATRPWPGRLTNATYLAWREHAETIDALASWTTSELTVRTPDGAPERAQIGRITASLFDVLDVPPAIGRRFSADDEHRSGGQVAVLSYGYWQRQFGGRADVIGRAVLLNGSPAEIVGVMPAAFAFPDTQTVLWTPTEVPPVVAPDQDPQRASRRLSIFQAIARLRAGVTAAQAAAEATARSRTAPDLGPVGVAMYGSSGPATVAAVPMADAITSDVRPALLLLLAAIGLLFVTAVANVASLQLARTSTRVREIAIRTTLGASGARIARQLFVENLMVGAIGGVCGLALAIWLHRLLPALLPVDFPRADTIAIDWPVVTITVGLTLAAGVAFGWLPFLLARRVSVTAALAEDGTAPAGGGLRTRVARTRAVVMVAQVAVAAVLLVGALLLSRSVTAMLHLDRGYEPEHLLTARLPMGDVSFTPQSRTTLVGTIVDRAAGLPGVTHAAVITGLPLMSGESLRSFPLPSLRPGQADVQVHTSSRIVSADYFAAAGVRVLEGRSFTSSDTLDSRPVVVVNRAFARAYLPTPAAGTDTAIKIHGDKEHWQVAGVVDDIREQSATDAPAPEMYECLCQIPEGLTTSAPSLVLRTTGDPASYITTLQRLVRELAPSVALDSVMTMDDRLRLSLARPRLYAVLLESFGGFALLIAGVGLFGVLSQSVARRRREIGVRTALGAAPGDVARLILRQGLGVTVVGLIVGFAAALALSRLISGFLFGVAPSDPVSFAAVAALLLGVAALACYLPARRAAKIDPLAALKS